MNLNINKTDLTIQKSRYVRTESIPIPTVSVKDSPESSINNILMSSNSPKTRTRCSECSGIGLIKKEIIICTKCNGIKCIFCRASGYKQMPYETCEKCDGCGLDPNPYPIG